MRIFRLQYVLAHAAWLVVMCVPLEPVSAQDPTGRTYAHLLDEAKTHPLSVDWIALRQAYAASPAYDTGVGSDAAIVRPMLEALQHQDWSGAASRADTATELNVMDLRAQFVATVADIHLGRSEDAARHRAAYLGILRAIGATGDGATPSSAFHVLATAEEYMLLETRFLTSQGQTLIRQQGHSYDRLSVVDPATGKRGVLYFNVDVSFPRETALALGTAKLVPEAALPR